MLNTQFSPWPSFTQQEADAVSKVLLSNKVNYWTGQECRHFEEEFANYTDSQYAIALGNGTLALDVALQALNIGAGDEVIVTPRTFIASISSVVNAGATPVFADVDVVGSDKNKALALGEFSSSFFTKQTGNKVVSKSDLKLKKGSYLDLMCIPTASMAAQGASFSDSKLGGMEKVSYIGAFGENDNWLKGWTNFDPNNTDY